MDLRRLNRRVSTQSYRQLKPVRLGLRARPIPISKHVERRVGVVIFPTFATRESVTRVRKCIGMRPDDAPVTIDHHSLSCTKLRKQGRELDGALVGLEDER